MNVIDYKTQGKVCSKNIHIETDGECIVRVVIEGGCHGNSQGVSRLLEGMKITDAIAKIEGINCKGKGTSCPDQIARALKTIEFNPM